MTVKKMLRNSKRARTPKGGRAIEFERELSEVVMDSAKSVSEKVRQVLEKTLRAPPENDLAA